MTMSRRGGLVAIRSRSVLTGEVLAVVTRGAVHAVRVYSVKGQCRAPRSRAGFTVITAAALVV